MVRNVKDRIYQRAITLSGSSSGVVWPTSTTGRDDNHRLLGLESRHQGFSFDYFVPREESEPGCVRSRHSQLATWISGDDTRQRSASCVCPDRITVLFQSGVEAPPPSVYILEDSAHPASNFKLPISSKSPYSFSMDDPRCFAWYEFKYLLGDVTQHLCQQWLKLLEVARSHMKQLVS